MEENTSLQLDKRIEQRRVFAPSLRPEFPKKDMLVELVNGCNHSCLFCGCSKMTRKRTEIDPLVLHRIMEEAYSLGVREIGFYYTNEPFLCKSLPLYVKQAKDIGFEYVYITTNGSVATEDALKSVLDNGLDSLKFSINAGTPETYEFLHGRPYFEKVIEKLKFCHKYRGLAGLKYKLWVSYIVTRYNEDEQELFRQNYGQYCDYISFTPLMNFGGFIPDVFERLAPPHTHTHTARAPDRQECHFLFKSIRITSEGYLTACGCADYQNYLVVADLNKESLYDGWYSDKFTELRRRYIDDSLDGLMCYNCVYDRQEPFYPLTPEYATVIDMDSVFSAKSFDERLAKFPKYQNM